MLLIVAFMVIQRCYQVRCYSTIFNYNFQTVLNAILYHKSRYFHRNHRYILKGMNVSSKAWLNAFYMIIFTSNRLSTAIMWQSLYAIVYSTKIMSLICFIWYSYIAGSPLVCLRDLPIPVRETSLILCQSYDYRCQSSMNNMSKIDCYRQTSTAKSEPYIYIVIMGCNFYFLSYLKTYRS